MTNATQKQLDFINTLLQQRISDLRKVLVFATDVYPTLTPGISSREQNQEPQSLFRFYWKKPEKIQEAIALAEAVKLPATLDTKAASELIDALKRTVFGKEYLEFCEAWKLERAEMTKEEAKEAITKMFGHEKTYWRLYNAAAAEAKKATEQ